MWLGLQSRETDLARFVGKILSDAGQRLMKDGKPLQGEAHEAELQRRVAEFEQGTLDVWSSLDLGAPSLQTSREQRRLRA